MSVQGIQEAANKAEKTAHSLAASVIAAAAAAPDNEILQLRAETVAVMIELGEKRAKLIPKEAVTSQVETIHEALAELQGQAEEGLIGRDDALEKLDRLQSLGFDLWLATHRRDAWEATVKDLHDLVGVSPRGT